VLSVIGKLVFRHSYIKASNINLSLLHLTRAGKVGSTPRSVCRRRQQDVNVLRRRQLTGGTACHIARRKAPPWRRRRRSTKRPTPLQRVPEQELVVMSFCRQLRMWFVESWQARRLSTTVYAYWLPICRQRCM